MKKLLAATLVVASVVGATAAFAFDLGTTVEGIVGSVDTFGNTVTLTDGATFIASPQLSIEPLQPGEAVTFMYQQGPDGQKEVTAFWIDAGSNEEN